VTRRRRGRGGGGQSQAVSARQRQLDASYAADDKENRALSGVARLLARTHAQTRAHKEKVTSIRALSAVGRAPRTRSRKNP
jgi:hypothetical protein